MRPIATDERTTLGALDVEECLVLLRWENIGRLAVSVADDGPLVVPVNFAMKDGNLIFRSSAGTKLDRLREQPVSLQVDRFDQYRRIGWSVLVRGVAQELTAREAADIGVDLDTWAPGADPRWVRLVPSTITGRRIELTTGLVDRRGYI